MREKLILSMETAVGAGSLSILKDGKEIDFWIGKKSTPKSEDLLPLIRNLLEKNKIKKGEIDLLTVSNGPGSYTGLRTGVAYALGLRKSFSCKLKGISMLEALALKDTLKSCTISAIPFGNNLISWQKFEIDYQQNKIKKSQINLTNEELFINELKGSRNRVLVVYETLFDKLKNSFENLTLESDLQIETHINLAKVIGQYADKNLAASDKVLDNVEPIYLKYIN